MISGSRIWAHRFGKRCTCSLRGLCACSLACLSRRPSIGKKPILSCRSRGRICRFDAPASGGFRRNKNWMNGAGCGTGGFAFVSKCAELVPDSREGRRCPRRAACSVPSYGRIFALSNVCRHQGGPLGEGRILAGCLTCPWHGYQYHVEDGCSPPPFHGGRANLRCSPDRRGCLRFDETAAARDEVGRRPDSRALSARGRRTIRLLHRLAVEEPSRSRQILENICAALFATIPILFLPAAKFQNPVDPGGSSSASNGPSKAFFLNPLSRSCKSDETGSKSGMNFLLVGSGKFGAPRGAPWKGWSAYQVQRQPHLSKRRRNDRSEQA